MNTLLVLLLLAASSPAATVLRVACGGPGGTDLQGNVWQPDIFYTGGAGWTVAPATGLTPPYLNLRYAASFTYTFQLQPGQYNVTLKFIEPNKTAALQRLFTVTINGTPVLQRLDLVATAGLLKPYDKTFPVVATSGQIQVAFTGNVGNAVISGLQVDSVDTQAPPTLAFACEGGWVADGGVDGIGGIFPASYNFRTCENMSASPYRILRARCRSNVPGPTFDVLAPDAANVYQSVLAAPMACAPEGVNTTVLPNSSYAAGHVLKFVIVIPEGQLVREVMGAVVVQEGQTAAKLASVSVCSGSGPGWSCDNLWRANIILANGALLSLMGVDMVPEATKPEITWTEK